ncbi:ComEC/Rec2 family competence protein [Sphingobium aquiterrae]|uniref:ComEC/Rec2 family competence protein n=1 Tax=Sphingobium aquiterrae TaxID=2038656 RepID=UPI0030182C3D
MRFSRRVVIGGLLGSSLMSTITKAGTAVEGAAVGRPLPARVPGELDIHHIDTGRGNCTLIIGPDGTSVMIDAGASGDQSPAANAPMPDGSMRPGQRQARYARRYLVSGAIDYFIATHVHPDHIGDILVDSPAGPDGAFRLTGVSDVDTLLPIGTVIDRGFPDYGRLSPPDAPFARNYLAYLEWRQRTGRSVERAAVGSANQIHLSRGASLRILGSSGMLWTGKGESTRSLFPKQAFQMQGGLPNENLLSTSLRLTYGAFSYFTGGDLANDDQDGRYPWLDVETPVVELAGPTEVVSADHHGYFDACGPNFVRSLDAQVYVIPSWHMSHPGQAQLQRMLGAWNGSQPLRDVFATNIHPENATLNSRFIRALKSTRGHVVVRVAAGGASFRVFVLESSAEQPRMLSVSGPYRCRESETNSAKVNLSLDGAKLRPQNTGEESR